jgi:hypothetical protein
MDNNTFEFHLENAVIAMLKNNWAKNYLCLTNEEKLKCLNDVIFNLQHEINIISHIQESS